MAYSRRAGGRPGSADARPLGPPQDGHGRALHAAARARFERGRLLDADAVDPLLGAAEVLLDLGRFADPRGRLTDALAVAASGNDRFQVYGAFQRFHDRRGEMSAAVRYMERGWGAGDYATVPLALV